MEGKASNILLKKWCPQQDILAHPNVKLFITHGGFLSTEEGVYHGSPMLYIPGFSDQFVNAARATELGIAEHLSWGSLTEEELE